jgi:SAM-dependent methyltransferase
MKALRKSARKMRDWFKCLLLNKPFVGMVNFGDLRRLKPIDSTFGYGRGEQSIARYYIDRFIAENAQYIRGRVLEIGDNRYTAAYGGDKVEKSDVLHVASDNPNATIVADLSRPTPIPDDSFDCIILTQTLQFIYDYQTALRQTHRILKRGGILLATLAGISQISRYDMDRWGEYWRFTSVSARRIFSEYFPEESITVAVHGNVLAAIAVLEGLASKELTKAELDYNDPYYEVIITVRAIKKVDLKVDCS